MDVREAVHQYGQPEEHGPAGTRVTPVDDQGGEDERQPAAPDDLQVRQVVPAELAEGEECAGDDGRRHRARHHPGQHRRAVPAEGQAEEKGEVVDDERRQSGDVERQHHESDAEEVLAERQRIPGRMEDRRLIHRPPVRPGVLIPVDDPGVEQRIAEIGHRRLETNGQRPRQDDGHGQKECEEEDLAEELAEHLLEV